MITKRISLILVGILFSLQGFSQSGDITYKKTFGGLKFYQHDQVLRPKQMLNKMSGNQEAQDYMKKAKTNYDVAQVLGGIGGFMVGWPIGTAIGSGEPNWTMAAIGGGIILLALPLSSGFNKNAKKAVEIYNNKEDASSRKMKFDFAIDKYGVGVVLRF